MEPQPPKKKRKDDDSIESDKETGGASSSSSSSSTAQPLNLSQQPERPNETRDVPPRSSGGGESSSSSSSSSAQPPNSPEQPERPVRPAAPRPSGEGSSSLSSSSWSLPPTRDLFPKSSVAYFTQRVVVEPTKLSADSRTTITVYEYVPPVETPSPQRTEFDRFRKRNRQERIPRPIEEPDLQGECQYLTEDWEWQKVKFLFFGKVLKLRYPENERNLTLRVDFGPTVVNRGLVGTVAATASLKYYRLPSYLPGDCTPTTLLCYFGMSAQTLWLIFPTEAVFVSFYGYWRHQICEIKHATGRHLRDSYELYDGMRERQNRTL